MKKVITLVLIAISSLLSSANAQCVKEGTKIVDVFYGFPDLISSYVEAAASETVGIDIGAIGPLGGKFEYLFTDNVGLGVIVGYGDNHVEWSESGYDYKESLVRYRVMGSFNYHFSTTEKFDAYFLTAAGYSNWSGKSESNDPNYMDDNVDLSIMFPLALRVGVGARYFFTDIVGAHFELGLGSGAILQAGVSAKF